MGPWPGGHPNGVPRGYGDRGVSQADIVSGWELGEELHPQQTSRRKEACIREGADRAGQETPVPSIYLKPESASLLPWCSHLHSLSLRGPNSITSL